MDTQLHAAIADFDALHKLLSAEAKPPVPLMDLEAFLATLNMANRADFDALHKLLSAEAKPPVPLMDLEAFLASRR